MSFGCDLKGSLPALTKVIAARPTSLLPLRCWDHYVVCMLILISQNIGLPKYTARQQSKKDIL